MIKFILYFTSVLLSLIGQSQTNGNSKDDHNFKNITPICIPNEDTINKNPKDMSKENPKDMSKDDSKNILDDENTKKIPDDLLCLFCEVETNSVSFSPCGHKTGNYCGNRLSRGEFKCPFCDGKIEYYENLDYLEDHDFEKQSPYRLRVLSENEINNLKSRIKKGMSDEEFMARFWYLRRCQEPDKYLLWNIEHKFITDENRIYIAELKKKLISGELSEISVYKNHFKTILDEDEYFALYGFYIRFENGNRRYEMEIRKKYINFIHM
ncbi:uncharacterized protein LOC126904086 isoform X1 [Daktulosphaira vitifoliae]|uniref:uncharacterized protein LOC126904086 isoform X1 n=1 Tax=Daktulosphaira vitifoliae TaxID=58002 RepID=UPI0021AA42B1|nr:uncharacterized protein LOC126904086 isoform X1 [Daktulosphaira vitifoliae]